jgi:hypothetical protein
MKKLLHNLYKIAKVLNKLVPTLLDILEDFGDDGKRNYSNIRSAAERSSAAERPLPPLEPEDN